MTVIRNWIYTNDERTEAVLFSDLSEQEQEEISIALNVQAMKQLGYVRVDDKPNSD